MLSNLPHIDGDGDIVEDNGFFPNLYCLNEKWHIDWLNSENRNDILFGFSGNTIEEAIQNAYDGYVIEMNKIIPTDELIAKLIDIMKKYGTNKVSLYRYVRDYDGDWYEQDMRELYNECEWQDDCLNGKYSGGYDTYPDDIEHIWNEVVDREIWKNPKYNIGTDGIYDESIMSAGHQLTIIFILNKNGTYKFEELCEFC